MLVVIPPYRIELSAGMAALLGLGVFVVGHVVLRAASRLAALPTEARAWRMRERRARADAALAGALKAQLEQRPEQVLAQARSALEGGADAVASALLAAQACHDLGDRAGRDDWLARVRALDAADPGPRLACERRWTSDESSTAATRPAPTEPALPERPQA